MARDQVGLMREFDFDQFQLVSHDRGAGVAHRLALDHPKAVTRLAVLDILPTRYSYCHVTRALATTNYFWFFMANDTGLPEHMIGADPDYWIRAVTSELLGEGASIEPKAMDDYLRCFRDPAAASDATDRSKLSGSEPVLCMPHNTRTGHSTFCPAALVSSARRRGGPVPHSPLKGELNRPWRPVVLQGAVFTG